MGVETTRKGMLVAAAAIALAGCQAQEPDVTTNAEDRSGGELIVRDADPAAVPVTVPDTPMTPVPEATDASRPAP